MGEWIIEVEAKRVDSTIIIRVKDNGIGFDTSLLSVIAKENSPHVGLYNIQRRLYLRYKEQASFNILSKIGNGTEVTIILYDSEKEVSDEL